MFFDAIRGWVMRNKKEVAPREEAESFLSARDQHADDDSDGACLPGAGACSPTALPSAVRNTGRVRALLCATWAGACVRGVCVCGFGSRVAPCAQMMAVAPGAPRTGSTRTPKHFCRQGKTTATGTAAGKLPFFHNGNLADTPCGEAVHAAVQMLPRARCRHVQGLG